ncbi:MAG: type I 3-dehydroquinate dehydratase, partial [Planctomycetota bacterium]
MLVPYPVFRKSEKIHRVLIGIKKTMICVSLQESTIEDLEKQINANLPFTSFFEFRLDEQSISMLSWILRADRPYRAIITLRSTGILPETDRITFLQKALQLGADWIDWDQPAPFPSQEPGRILYSYHDWQKTPDMEEIKRLYGERKHKGSWIKLVFRANTFTDNLTIRKVFRKLHDPQLVSFCMGEEGQTSRILSCLWGSAWTYAAPSPEKKTAPGQLTADEMSRTYPQSQGKREPSLYFGILGNPVSQSWSPLLHNMAFQEKKISALYLPVEVKDPLPVLSSGFFQGLSVTMPFKEVLCEWTEMLSLSPEVNRWKSLNTLIREGNTYHAENTDVWAGVALLENFFFFETSKRVVIWGSGGVARSLALALSEKNCSIRIQARNEKKGKVLAYDCGGEFIPWETPILEPVDLLIQGTPVGMIPHTQQIP